MVNRYGLIVHDLQPLNAVTIRDSSTIPVLEQLTEWYACRAILATLDIFVGYDERTLAIHSRDLTTFQTPLGPFRLTAIPMGWTNSVQIFHGDVTYINQPEIPEYTIPYLDDVNVRGGPTRYESPEGSFETIPANPGIRRFVWEHLQVVNRILQRMKYAGGTYSGLKAILAAPEAMITGHLCSYKG